MEQFINQIPHSPLLKKQNKDGKIIISKIPPLKLSSNHNQKDINFNVSNWIQLDKFKIRPFGTSPTSDRASTAIHTPSTLRRKVVKSSIGNSSQTPSNNGNLFSGLHSRTQSQQLYQTNGQEILNKSMSSPQNNQQIQLQLQQMQTQHQPQLLQSSTSPFILSLAQQQPLGNNINAAELINEQKFSMFIKQYINTNPLFTQHKSIIPSLENIPNDIKQTLDVLHINNNEKNKKKISNNLVSNQTKSILFSFLDKLQKQILDQCKITFQDRLINETIKIFNEVIPLVIRQLSDLDSYLGTFCEGFYKFYIVFMDNIQSRLQYKIKREMNEKYLENEKVIQDQKMVIAQLKNEIQNLQKSVQQEKNNTINVEGKFREEIINLNSTIQEMKFNLEDMQNLDFAPTQLEKLAKTTNKMSSMIKKESTLTQQTEIKTESQLLALSNVLLAISKKKLNDSEILSRKYNFFSSVNDKISRIYGEHPFTKCLNHFTFLGMANDEKSPKNRKNIKTLLSQFFHKQLVGQRSENNPCDQLIEYLQNEICTDYEEVCQQIGNMISFLKDTYENDHFSHYFCQIFGLFDNPLPSKEEIKLQVLIFQKLQQINDEKKNSSLDNDDNNTQQISIAQFERIVSPSINNHMNSESESKVKFQQDSFHINGSLNMLSYNPISEFNHQTTYTHIEYNLPLDTVFEEIPWSSISKIFDQMEWNLHFADTIKQKIQLSQINVVQFLSKLLSLTTLDVKDQQNFQINTVISKFGNFSTNQQKLNHQDLINLCASFKIKHSDYIQYTLYLYQEELQLKQRLLNTNVVEIIDNEFNEIIKNSFLQMLKLQKLSASPFIKNNSNQLFKPSQTNEAISEEQTMTNNSLASNENLNSSTRKLFKRSFNKLKVQNSLSKLGSRSNLDSPLSERASPLVKLSTKQSTLLSGQTSPNKGNVENPLSSKFSKFKK